MIYSNELNLRIGTGVNFPKMGKAIGYKSKLTLTGNSKGARVQVKTDESRPEWVNSANF